MGKKKKGFWKRRFRRPEEKGEFVGEKKRKEGRHPPRPSTSTPSAGSVEWGGSPEEEEVEEGGSAGSATGQPATYDRPPPTPDDRRRRRRKRRAGSHHHPVPKGRTCRAELERKGAEVRHKQFRGF